MNSLIHLIAIVLTIWATWWFLSHNSEVVAFGVAGITLLLMLWFVQAIIEDVSDARSNYQTRRRGRKPRAGRDE
jgi:hypothetical protein